MPELVPAGIVPPLPAALLAAIPAAGGAVPAVNPVAFAVTVGGMLPVSPAPVMAGGVLPVGPVPVPVPAASAPAATLVTVLTTAGMVPPVRLVRVPVTAGRTPPVRPVTVPVTAGSTPPVRLVRVPVTAGRTPPVRPVTVPVTAGRTPPVRPLTVPVRPLTVPVRPLTVPVTELTVPVTELTVPVMALTVTVTLATVLVAAAWTGCTIGCAPLARLFIAWVALWTTPLTVAVGEDGACGDAPEVSAPTVPVSADSVPAGVSWLAGAVWALGCGLLARLWMAWVALWTTPLTALVTGEEGAGVVWLAVGAVLAAVSAVLDTVLTAAAGALDAGVLDAGVLDAGVPDAGVPLLLAVA